MAIAQILRPAMMSGMQRAQLIRRTAVVQMRRGHVGVHEHGDREAAVGASGRALRPTRRWPAHRDRRRRIRSRSACPADRAIPSRAIPRAARSLAAPRRPPCGSTLVAMKRCSVGAASRALRRSRDTRGCRDLSADSSHGPSPTPAQGRISLQESARHLFRLRRARRAARRPVCQRRCRCSRSLNERRQPPHLHFGFCAQM